MANIERLISADYKKKYSQSNNGYREELNDLIDTKRSIVIRNSKGSRVGLLLAPPSSAVAYIQMVSSTSDQHTLNYRLCA